MNNKIKYNRRIVAYIDILGFSNLVSSLEKQPELHSRLYRVLAEIKSYKMTSLSANTAHSDLEVSVFSDSIVISAEEDNLWGIIWATGWLHATLLGIGTLTRGGISIGKTVHKDDILYGDGMLKAYRIESSAAVYPRIVMDTELIKLSNGGIKQIFLEKDRDGLWFVDPFSFSVTVGDATELAADGYDPHELYLIGLGKHIDNGIKQAIQMKHISKWTWLKLRYDKAFEDYLKTRETKLDKLSRMSAVKKSDNLS